MTKIGFFSAGLNTYWAQFEGLNDSLLGYGEKIAGIISEEGGVSVRGLGMVDSPERAQEAARELKEAGIDLLGIETVIVK